MATITLGTNAVNTLTAIAFTKGMAIADIATIAQAILDDTQSPLGQVQGTPAAKPIWPGAFDSSGRLFIPNRGVLQVLPGDYIGVDANGWPILLSANAIAGGSTPSASTSWTHS